MKTPRRRLDPAAPYVETPMGLFTASGVWFRTTVRALEAFAGPVLRRVPLQELIARSEHWLRSPQTLALWTLAGFLPLIAPAGAAIGALLVFVCWAIVGPSFANRPLERLFTLLGSVPLQFVAFVALLSLLAAGGRYAAAATGTAGFILLRWGVVEWAAGPLVRRAQGSLYPLPAPDQVLRRFIVGAARRHGIRLGDQESGFGSRDQRSSP